MTILAILVLIAGAGAALLDIVALTTSDWVAGSMSFTNGTTNTSVHINAGLFKVCIGDNCSALTDVYPSHELVAERVTMAFMIMALVLTVLGTLLGLYRIFDDGNHLQNAAYLFAASIVFLIIAISVYGGMLYRQLHSSAYFNYSFVLAGISVFVTLLSGILACCGGEKLNIYRTKYESYE